MRPSTILDLARELKMKLPARNVEELKGYVQVKPTCRSLTEFLSAFDFFYPMLRTPAAVERIAYERCEDCARENIRYAELRFAPILQTAEGFNMEEVVRAALRGARQGQRAFGVRVGLILCFLRGTPFSVSQETIRLAIKFRDRGVAGVDLAGDELRYPQDTLYRAAFRQAVEARVPITMHAGESGGPERIRVALDYCWARRIGHGTHLFQDPELMERARREGIPLEVCVTSNVQTQVASDYEHHPVLDYHRRGLVVTLNTDDPAVSGIDLTHEYEMAVSRLRFTLADLIRVVMNGVDAAFLPDQDRRELRRRMKREFEMLLKENVTA